MNRSFKRGVYQSSSVLQVRAVFTCDEKKATFYFQLANPVHLDQVKNVELRYLLRRRIPVAEDHKMTRWNPTQKFMNYPYANGLDGQAKRKGESAKPFQYLWVDPEYTCVRR